MMFLDKDFKSVIYESLPFLFKLFFFFFFVIIIDKLNLLLYVYLRQIYSNKLMMSLKIRIITLHIIFMESRPFSLKNNFKYNLFNFKI